MSDLNIGVKMDEAKFKKLLEKLEKSTLSVKKVKKKGFKGGYAYHVKDNVEFDGDMGYYSKQGLMNDFGDID